MRKFDNNVANEKDKLLGASNNDQVKLEMVVLAVHHQLLVLTTIIITILSLLVTSYLHMMYPKLSVNFAYMIVLVGHIALGYQLIYIAMLLYRSLFLESTNIRANIEERLSLCRYVIANMGWVVLASIGILSIELTSYFSRNKRFSTYLMTFIVSLIALIISVLMRSVPTEMRVTFIFTMTTVLKFCLKLSLLPLIPWSVIFISVYILFGFWIYHCVNILLKYEDGTYRLKKFQVEAVVLYQLSVVLLILSTLSCQWSLENASKKQRYMNLSIAFAFFGSGIFFAAYYTVVNASIIVVVEKMGNSRPKHLIKSPFGWEESTKSGVDYSPLIGDIDFVSKEEVSASIKATTKS